MTIYWTSDPHFFHKNIIKYQNRPFRDTDHMNESLIANWNERVGPDDIIYCLGDFGFAQERKMQQVLDRLQGHKHLILGNHDKHAGDLSGWDSVGHYAEIYVDKQFVILFHYAQRIWNRAHHGAIQLYGHSHSNMPGNSQSLDVGVDCWNYRPVNFGEIQARLKTLPKFTGYAKMAGGSDHHTGKDLDDDELIKAETGYARVSTNLGKY